MGLLGKEMVEAYHLVNLPEEDAIRNLKIPIIFDIYKEELLPAKIVVDMSDVMGDLYKSYGGDYESKSLLDRASVYGL